MPLQPSLRFRFTPEESLSALFCLEWKRDGSNANIDVDKILDNLTLLSQLQTGENQLKLALYANERD